MYGVDLYRRVRLACHREGLSRREASRQFGIDRKTVAKILLHSEPPGYRRREPPKRPKLAPFTAIIDRILAEDRTVHRKQRHTAKRIFERLRDEHGFTGKQTIVKDYVRERRLRLREMFVPLAHAPGHAQADFGEADAIIAGVLHRAHFFVMTLPHSDACFVAAYPAATTEAWLDGHNAAFAFFGGVPRSILYDNDKCLVSRILPDGTRQRTRSFSGLQSHYLFEDRYGRPGKGNDKGNVEGVVGYARRNFMTPRPRFASWDAFNAYLEEQCRKRQGDVVRGHRETIGERLRRDCEALMVLPPAPFDACDRQGTRVSSLSLVYEPVGGRRVMTDTPQLLLAHHLKTLRLPTFLREYDKLARQCAAEGADHVRYLVRLAELELIDRERRMVERRIRQARFPAVKSLDAFDFKALPSLNKMLVVELARCEYVERRENIIALGNSGTGKTHIALGLGLAACQKGLSVGFTTAAALVHELMEARDEKRLLRFQKQLAKYSLLIIDELGFVPLSKTGAELLFEVFSQRYERGATLVTSNLPFDEWTEIFGSERLTGALLDRLTHHVHILEMNGESYRLNQSQKRGKSPKTPA
jgi:DNA replication protein DnaC/transposase